MSFTKEEARRLARIVQERLAEGTGRTVREECLEVLTLAAGDGIADEDDVERLTAYVTRELEEFGALQPLLDDDDVTEICVNGHKSVYVEIDGTLEPVTDRLFESDEEVMRLIDRIAAPLNKRCDAQSPMMDARLPDGSRVNAAIPPIARFGPCITIRKFPKRRYDADDLVEMGACSIELMQFLACMVESGCNILVSGGTGTGKTTMLNVLCGFILDDERVVTVEDTAELQLTVDDWVSMEARTANADGGGEITIHQLVVNALRQRPDRIIVGECRSSETVEMLQAMNTGHDGSLTTVHANDPRSAFLRIETMVQATENLTERNIDKQIASAIQIVVQLKRYRDGSRKVSEVIALTGGMEGDTITCEELFRFVEDGENADGEVVGRHVALGARLPERIMERVRRSGSYYDEEWLAAEGGRR